MLCIRASETYTVSRCSSLKLISHTLSVQMSNARKLFRVLKWLIEYKKINTLLGKADSIPIYKLILQLCPRIAFFFYWILDTFLILGKIKVLPNIDVAKIT